MAKSAKKSAKKQSITELADAPCYGGKPDAARERAYRAESDARTLLQAQEIREDKERLSAAREWAGERAAELKSIGSISAGTDGDKY